MRIAGLGAIALALTCTAAAAANAVHLNPDQAAASSDMQTFGATTIPIGYYRYCQKYRERCERPAEAASVELTRERWKVMIDVNNFANASVRPLTDLEIFGVEEKWEYPKGVGDCEDYALLKRELLHKNGFPLGSLLLTVGRDADGGGHAVLTVVTDSGDFILDNLEPKILLWRDAEIYFLKRQSGSEPNTWVSLLQDSDSFQQDLIATSPKNTTAGGRGGR